MPIIDDDKNNDTDRAPAPLDPEMVVACSEDIAHLGEALRSLADGAAELSKRLRSAAGAAT